MKKIDIDAMPTAAGSNYPDPFDAPCAGRFRRKLARGAGLTQFGVNLTTIPSGVWSSQRHWHTHEDEFVWIVSGELILITDAGEEVMRAGDCAAFKAGERDGHHLVNRSGAPATVLEVGTGFAEDVCDYPDIDMVSDAQGPGYLRRDGTPYPVKEG
jgi:uncharacterized cupin superfamily protein